VKVEFRRTAARRYAVSVHRDGPAPIVMAPAPGYDPLMPHDLLHLIVEGELGLARGIFGQLAAGGHAGRFALRRLRDRIAVKRRGRGGAGTPRPSSAE
jgi:hypothetical protein